VAEPGIAEDDDLRTWLELGVRHTQSLPSKAPRRTTSRPSPNRATSDHERVGRSRRLRGDTMPGRP
jgi:hypothetical protein